MLGTSPYGFDIIHCYVRDLTNPPIVDRYSALSHQISGTSVGPWAPYTGVSEGDCSEAAVQSASYCIAM